MQLQLSKSEFITRVALQDGVVADSAVWIVRLGIREPHPLAQFIRKLTIRERCLHLYSMTTQKINTWLPKWFNEWLWPVSEEKRKSAERRQNLMRNRRSCMEKWLPGSNHENDYLILNSLTVLPEFERRGIGKALMQEGLEMARKYRVSIYLVASPAGKGLYERLGFDVLDEHEMGDRERVRWRETVMKFEGR